MLSLSVCLVKFFALSVLFGDREAVQVIRSIFSFFLVASPQSFINIFGDFL